MIKSMRERGPSVSYADVEQLEASIGRTLPDDFKAFLMQYNGGRPEPNEYPLVGLDNNPYGMVHFFFGIDDPVESCNLEWNFEVMNGRIPDNLFPIACDDGGDLLCLSLYGDDAGSVVFWDYYAEHFPPTYDNIYRIPGADSFSAFIELLQYSPDDPDSP
ncbi:MAG: SMI1/KNR4 family protein [Candidatus Hydrogenedentales bacterium]